MAVPGDFFMLCSQASWKLGRTQVGPERHCVLADGQTYMPHGPSVCSSPRMQTIKEEAGVTGGVLREGMSSKGGPT